MTVSVGMKDIVIVYGQGYAATANLFFVDGDCQTLFIRVGHLRQYQNVTLVTLEMFLRVKVQDRFEFDIL